MTTWTLRTYHENPNDEVLLEGVVGCVLSGDGLVAWVAHYPGDTEPEPIILTKPGLLSLEVELSKDDRPVDLDNWGAEAPV